MIRPATAPTAAIFAIRDKAGENRLSNPASLTETLANRLVAAGGMWVWQEPGGSVAGFVAADVGEAAIAALLVARGRTESGHWPGPARDRLRGAARAGHGSVTVVLEPGTPGERHYRAAGWTVVR